MVEKKRISDRVKLLLSEHAKTNGPLRPPIEPVKFLHLCNILSVEHRSMVPEGVLAPVDGGFRMYLQSNFAQRRGTKRRERFTLAHELIHTFFYDLNAPVPKPAKKSPKGEYLERLCHIGAASLLVPEDLLWRELKSKGRVASVDSIIELAKVFDVSVEVMVRRFHELSLVAEEDFAAILVEKSDSGRSLIRTACYGTIMLCSVVRPRYGLDFETWVLPLMPPSNESQETEWERAMPSASIKAKRIELSNRSFILELTFGPPKGKLTTQVP